MLVPLKNPSPDIKNFKEIMMGEKTSSAVPLMEYLVDEIVRKHIGEKYLGQKWVEYDPKDLKTQEQYWKNYIDFWYRMGYDYVRLELNIGFRSKSRIGKDTAGLSIGERSWAEETEGVIKNWEDFETYSWPNADTFDYSPFEFVSKNLPEGMGLIVSHGAGVEENVVGLLSYQGLCYGLYDQPKLVKAVFQKVGEGILTYYKNLIGLPNLVSFFQGDDMGFKTATLLPPKVLRENVLPWHEEYAALAHQNDLPYFLHSCGNVEVIMDDLINKVRIDGKHSFEDAIIPVTEFKKKYGERIAVLGGIDMNVLASFSEKDLRSYVRRTLEICHQGGRYALGSGNSISNYIPISNYLSMLDEGLRFNGRK